MGTFYLRKSNRLSGLKTKLDYIWSAKIIIPPEIWTDPETWLGLIIFHPSSYWETYTWGGGFKTKTLELYANAIYYAGEDQQVKIQMQAEIQRIKAMKYNEKMTTVYYSISGCEF